MKTANGTVLTRKELAERLGVGIRTVDWWIRRGIHGVKLGVDHVGCSVRIPLANYKLFQELVDQRRGVKQ